jgi:Rrf2 family nitric oxide-sensitive transcriptional repressor
MFIALKGEEPTTIDEIVEHYGINRNHLVKVVFRLGQLGYLDTSRSKGLLSACEATNRYVPMSAP